MSHSYSFLAAAERPETTFHIVLLGLVVIVVGCLLVGFLFGLWIGARR